MAPPKRDDNRDTWRDEKPTWTDELILGVAIAAVIIGLGAAMWLACTVGAA